MIPKDKIDDVLFAADLKKVAEDCGLKLRRAGAVLYKACCPFHNETDGSFFVNTNTNRWTCYGCDRSGNAIDLVMEKKGLSFPDAVKLLAAEHGITIEERQPTKEEEERERERSGQLIIHEEAAHFYQRRLKENLTALEYARSRFDDKTIETFRLGYAPREPSELYSHLRQKGFSIEALEKCNLFRERKGFIHDFYRDRLMFPIINARGEVVAFSGRALHPSEDNPKYLNNSESVTYTKGSVLFGMNFAFRHIRSADMSVLVEGNADVVKMHQLGVCNVVATCGTSLTDEQIRQLGKASKNITLMLDGDEPGQKATDKNGRRLVESGLYVYVLTIPKAEDGSKQDPDSFFTSKEHFEEFKAEHSKMFLVALAESKKEACVNDPMTRARTVKDIARLFADRDPAERGELANLLAQIGRAHV